MTDAQVRKELAGFNPKVRIGADTKSAQVAITSFQARVAALSKQLSSMRADTQTKDAESKIASVQARVLTLAKQMRGLTMTADAKKLDAQIAGEVAKLKGLQLQMSSLQADVDTKKAAAEIADLQKKAFHLQEDLDSGKLKARVDITDAEAKLELIDARLRVLGDNAKAVKLAADSKSILAQIEVVKGAISGLQAQAKDIQLGANIDPAKLLASESALLAIEHTVEALGKKDVPTAGTAMGAFFSSMNRGSTAAAYGWKILTGHITLFGGVFNKLLPAMFTSVAVWHLLIDAAIEIVAVWAPAIVAVTAFGVAGVDAAKAIYQRMSAVHTVMDATGRAVPPLTSNFAQLAKAVKPEVYQLFGDALLVMGRRGGAFNSVATQTGRVLDQLGARFVLAITQGAGVNKFMEHAVSDVAKLGDSFANLGGIFGAVFRAVPGYAEILLSVGDAILHVISVAAQAGEPIIAVGLALHGFFIYGGAAVTVSLALVAGVVKLIGAFGKFNEAVTLVGLNSLKAFALGLINGVKGIAGYSIALVSLARSEGIAAAGSIALADAQTLLSKVPTIFWITLAASAIAGLVIWLRSAHTATQEFVSGLNQTIQAASLSSVLTTIQKSQTTVTQRLAAAQRDLANTSQYVATQNLHTGAASQMLNGAWVAAKGNVDALRAAQSQLSDQYQLISGRIGGLSKEYGGNTQALGALNLAGITTAQITDKNKEHWALALIQVEATTAAYKAMGIQSGQLGNDLDVLGRTETDQYTATQKLNQAWSAFISDVTGTQGAFDTVAQGFETLSTHSQDIKLSLGKLKTGFNDAKAGIDSLTGPGIALNQAFSDQVTNIDKLIASWRTAGLANNLFVQGTKDAIAPMVQYAKGSQEATAQLIALAQEAGYQGPISMAALTKWLGNTHGATKNLKDITNQATVQEALLTGAMQNQGAFIANTLIGDINSAILAYNGVGKAASAYGKAIAEFGKGTTQANTAQKNLVDAIVKSGTAIGDNAKTIEATLAKVLGISMPQAAKLFNTAMASTGLTAGAATASIAADFTRQQKAATTASGALGAYSDAIRRNGADSGKNKPARDQLVNDMISAGVKAKTANADVDNYTAAVRKNGIDSSKNAPARQQLITDILGATNNARQGQKDLSAYTAEVRKNGSDTDTARSARQQLIKDLVNAGLSSKTATGLVDGLQNSINALHGKTVTIIAEASGSGTIAITGSGWALGQGNVRFHAAQGAFINAGSGPTADDVPAMLSRGELVVPAKMVQSGAVDHLRGQLPGFAAGGFVGLENQMSAAMPAAGQIAGGLAGKAASTAIAQVMAKIKAQVDKKAAAAAVARASSGGPGSPGPGGGAPAANAALARKLMPAWGSGAEWNAWNALEMSEAGWNQFARNPSSGAYGIPQALPPGKMGAAANPPQSNPTAQIRWMIGYIQSVYGDPIRADAHENAFHWYKHGGLVQKLAAGGLVGTYAAGGQIPVAKYLPQLKTAQSNEYQDYAGLRKAYLTDLKSARKGSWTSGHRAGITSELATLAKRQSLEEAGYDNILHHGTAKANLAKLTSRVKAVAVTSRDKDLAHSHPGWSHGLQYWLGVLTHLSSAGVAPAYGGTEAKLQFPAYISRLKGLQAHEVSDYGGLRKAFNTGLAQARKGSWLYGHKAAVRNELNTLATRQGAEAKAYGALIKQTTGVSLPTMYALHSALSAEQTAVKRPDLSHTPGGHPGWVHGLEYWLGQLVQMSLQSSQPFNLPWSPGNLGPSHSVSGGVLQFDTGRGVLAPGMNLAWNGTGRSEALSSTGAGGTQAITLEIAPGGGSEFEQFMYAMIRRFVRVNGGGNAQTAFGRS